MKVGLALCCVMLLLGKSDFLVSQITINSNDFADQGDTVRYSNASNFFLNYTATGADFTWDFSQLSAQSQTLVEYFDINEADILTQSVFGFFAQPTYRANYYLPAPELPLNTLSNLVNSPIDELYRFYKKTNSEITVVGLSISIGNFGLPQLADTLEVAYQFPMVYGQNYNSSGYLEMDLTAVASFALKQSRQRNSEVDGWGTITTPYGTFECLRIHHIINEFDSVLLDLGNGPTWVPIEIPVIHEYEWWTNNQNGPILKVKSNEIFGFPIVNEVMYRDNFRPDLNVSIPENLVNEVVIYPNPSRDFLQIETSLKDYEIRIFDLNGKVLYSDQNSSKIDVSQFDPGVYIIQILNSEKILRTEKFIKE